MAEIIRDSLYQIFINNINDCFISNKTKRDYQININEMITNYTKLIYKNVKVSNENIKKTH